MTIEDFFRLLLRNAVLLILAVVLGGAAGYAASYSRSPVYEASALGFVRSAAGSAQDGTDSPMGQQQYSKAQFFLPLFTTAPVSEAIAERTGETPGSLVTSLDPNAPIITVTAQAHSPEAAAAIANASVEAVADEAAKLDPSTKDTLRPYVQAHQPTAPISPDRKKWGAAGAAAGLLIGLGIAWLRSRNDSRIRTVDDVRDKAGVPALGVLPDVKDLSRGKDGSLAEPASFTAREALRKLRTNLRFVDVDSPPRSIVITSSAPGEGKSTVSGNLGRVMARAGQRTILIDGDMRKPMLSTGFGIDGAIGLSQVLAGTVRLEDAVQRVGDHRLVVLPAGQIPPNPSELVGSRRMHDLIAELSKEYFVIVDAPPVLAVTDAQLLARHTDGAILVAIPGRTRAEGLIRAVESIRGIGAAVLGAVLNRASTGRLNRLAYGDAEYGYSSYGYGRYAKKGYGDGYVASEPEIDEVLVDPSDPVAAHDQGSAVPGAVEAVGRAFGEAPDARPAAEEPRGEPAATGAAGTARHDAAGSGSSRRGHGKRAARSEESAG